MAFKRTSEQIQISTDVVQGVANTFEVTQVDLQLNPLDQEIFVVTGVKIDFDHLPAFITPSVSLNPVYECGLTTTRPLAMPNISQSNCFGYSSIQGHVTTDAGGNISCAFYYEQNAMDAPPAGMDYLAIIATSNFFISVDSSAFGAPATAQDARVRVFGYRAKADAATYAALVQSEVLSA